MTAAALLGSTHPLVDVLRRLRTAVEQMLAVAALGLVACILLHRAAPFAVPLATAAGLVGISLGVRLALLRQYRRELCLELLVEGADRLPLRAVERAARRVQEPRNVARLACSLQDLAGEAVRPPAQVPGSPPLVSVPVLRAVEPQLLELADLLRSDEPPVRGVALIEQLAGSGTSPLYGTDAERLRRELGRARYLLLS